MKSTYKKTAIAILAIAVFYSTAEAQVNDTSIQRKNQFLANATYQSALHYFGRTDSLRSQGFFPSIGFETKPGFYGNASFIFLNNPVQNMDYTGTVVEGGYRFPEKKNFSGNVFYSHFLYEDNSTVVQAALKGQTGVNLTWNNKIVNVNGGADLKFSNRTDLGLTAGLDRLFIYLIPKTKYALAINPSAYVYGGTQNFTQTVRKRNQIAGLPVGGQQTVSEEVTQFSVLSYEFSAPVVFVAGKFNATISPAYVMPQNLIKVANRPDISENGKNMFYVSASVGVRL
ncbi:MAG: hypothetical protein JWQ96_1843 [Segetibacter sp.]|nr:hypothetical protein [Segetibacter sp.]